MRGRDVPEPPKVRPVAPKELSGDALAEWDRMIGRLEGDVVVAQASEHAERVAIVVAEHAYASPIVQGSHTPHVSQPASDVVASPGYVASKIVR